MICAAKHTIIYLKDSENVPMEHSKGKTICAWFYYSDQYNLKPNCLMIIQSTPFCHISGDQIEPSWVRRTGRIKIKPNRTEPVKIESVLHSFRKNKWIGLANGFVYCLSFMWNNVITKLRWIWSYNFVTARSWIGSSADWILLIICGSCVITTNVWCADSARR